MRFSIVTALLSLALITSCAQKSFETEEDLWEYLRDPANGYLHKKTINDVDFSVVQRPTDLLVKQELGDTIDVDKIKELREKYNRYIYLTLSMSKNNQELLSAVPKNRNEFGVMVNQLAFGMGDKVHVYTPKKDTLALLDYSYPRMYGMSRSTSMLFVYPRDEKYLKEDHLFLTIEDLGTYTGEVKFKLPIKQLINQPTLKF